MQEQTEQQKQMAKIKEYELSMEQMKLEGKRVDGEQKRKYLEEEAKQQKHKAEYQVRYCTMIIQATFPCEFSRISKLNVNYNVSFCFRIN